MRQKFITKCVRVFITKCDSFIKNTTVLLQNATVIPRCDVYYKLRQYNTLNIPIMALFGVNGRKNSALDQNNCSSLNK